MALSRSRCPNSSPSPRCNEKTACCHSIVNPIWIFWLTKAFASPILAPATAGNEVLVDVRMHVSAVRGKIVAAGFNTRAPDAEAHPTTVGLLRSAFSADVNAAMS
jgi:hypothetical protein